MEVLSIIIFGLATVRSISPLTKDETYKSGVTFTSTLLVGGTMCYCYYWFVGYIVNN